MGKRGSKNRIPPGRPVDYSCPPWKIWELMVKHDGVCARAAREAGVSDKVFRARCKEFGFDPTVVKSAKLLRAEQYIGGTLEDKMEQRAHKIIDDPDKNPDDYVKFFALVFDMKAKRAEQERALWEEWNKENDETPEERERRERQEDMDAALRAAQKEVGGV